MDFIEFLLVSDRSSCSRHVLPCSSGLPLVCIPCFRLQSQWRKVSCFHFGQRDEWNHLPGCEFEPVLARACVCVCMSRGMSRTLTPDRFLDQLSFPAPVLYLILTPMFLCLRTRSTPGSTATGDIFIFIHQSGSGSRACYSIHSSAPYSASKERASGEKEKEDEIDILTDGNPDDEGADSGDWEELMAIMIMMRLPSKQTRVQLTDRLTVSHQPSAGKSERNRSSLLISIYWSLHSLRHTGTNLEKEREDTGCRPVSVTCLYVESQDCDQFSLSSHYFSFLSLYNRLFPVQG